MAKRCQLMLKEIYERAESDGDKALVVDLGGRRKTSRKDFVRLVNSGAYYLKKKGIAAGDIVALELGRSMEHIAMRLACHCIGAVYVSVNPDYPEDRKKGLYLSCNPVFILKEDMLSGIELGEYPCQIDEELNDNDPGVIVFTSGTTGVPKGILHDRSIYFAVGCMPGTYGFDEGEKEYAAVADMMFNVSTGDMFAIFHHWTMHIIDDETRKDPAKLRKYFIEHSIQVTIILPSLFRIIMPVESMKYVLLVGEPTTFDLSEYSTEAINFYGSSEAGAISYGFAKREKGIGRNYPHGRIYLIDEDGKEIEKGDMTRSGEVCFTGLSVMIGYLGKEALAEERIETEDGEEFIVRTFHTKDIGRYNDDGTITVFGRMDSTVKVRGNRVNTTEVEYAIINIPGIKEAAVKSFEKKGENYLCAYYTSLDGEELEAGMITDSLRKSIPEYMVPAFFIHKKEFEKNVHGKIDREKLEAPERRQKEYVKPQGEIEAEVAEVIREVAGIKLVGAEDSLVSMGVSSLKAIGLQMEIEDTFSVSISAAEILQIDTVRGISAEIRKRAEDKEKGTAKTEQPAENLRKEYYPLTNLAWAMFQCSSGMKKHNDPRLRSYHMAFVLKIQNRSVGEISEALRRIADTHPILKSSIELCDGEPYYVRRDDWYPQLTEHVISEKPGKKFFASLYRTFDIPGEELFRTELFRYNDDKYVFVDIHHLAADAYSLWLIRRNLKNAFMDRELLKEEISCFDLIERMEQSREISEEENKYVLSLLSDRKALVFPQNESPESSLPVYGNSSTYVFIPGMSEKCRKAGVKQSSVVTAACLRALSECSGKNRFWVPSFTFGRRNPDEIKTVGCLYDITPVVYDRAEGKSLLNEVEELEQQLKNTSEFRFQLDNYPEYFDTNSVIYNYLADYDLRSIIKKRKLTDDVELFRIPAPEFNYANLALEIEVIRVSDSILLISIDYNRSMYTKKSVSAIGKKLSSILYRFLLKGTC